MHGMFPFLAEPHSGQALKSLRSWSSRTVRNVDRAPVISVTGREREICLSFTRLRSSFSPWRVYPLSLGDALLRARFQPFSRQETPSFRGKPEPSSAFAIWSATKDPARPSAGMSGRPLQLAVIEKVDVFSFYCPSLCCWLFHCRNSWKSRFCSATSAGVGCCVLAGMEAALAALAAAAAFILSSLV